MRGRPSSPQRRHGVAQIVPRHRLRLLEKRREIGEARSNKLIPQRRALQVLDAGHGLAGAAMGDDAGEALGAGVERHELAALRIVDYDTRSSHSTVTVCG